MSRSIAIGIVGSGNVLPAYLQNLDRLAPRGVAHAAMVCARRAEKQEELRLKRPGIALVADARAVFESAVDAVLILTPPESHPALVREALEHGKHVIVEKPLAATRAEAEPLAELADKKRLYLLCAPFVQLAPTFRAYCSQIEGGAIGKPHSARGLYGNFGSDWAAWYHNGSVGPLAEVGIYNLKSLACILGPVKEVASFESVAVQKREVDGRQMEAAGPDVSHVILRHVNGAVSSVVASHSIQRYKRPGLEVYGTEGTANLLGDDWDPRGFELYRAATGYWEKHEALDATWLWTDGVTEMADALRQGRAPLHNLEQDLHLLDVIEACGLAAQEKRTVEVRSQFEPMSLGIRQPLGRKHLHDHTRPADEQ